MKTTRRLLPFVILNILISAITTLVVLAIWDAIRRNDLPPLATLSPQLTEQPSPTPTLPSTDAPVIEIENIFGAGDLQTEVVLIRRLGDGELWLEGWKLEDENGHKYIFPGLMLNKDGALKLYTRGGTNTVIALYWGQNKPVWKKGERASLYDPEGNLRAWFIVP